MSTAVEAAIAKREAAKVKKPVDKPAKIEKAPDAEPPAA